MFNNPVTNSLWTESHRPQTLSDYVGNDDLKSTMERYIEQDDIPHLLFHARAGTGKCLAPDEEIIAQVELSEEEISKYSKYII